MKNIFKKNQLMITALAIMIAIAGYLQFAENTMEKEPYSSDAAAVDSGKIITEHYTAGEYGEPAGSNLNEILDLSQEDLLFLDREDFTDSFQNAREIASLDSDTEIVMEDYLDHGMGTEDGLLAGAGKLEEEAPGVSPSEGEIPGEAVFTSAGSLEILTDAKILKEQTRAKNKETLLDIIGNEYLSDDQKQNAVSSMVTMTQIAEKEAAAEILLEAKGFSDAVVSISEDGADVVVNAVSLTDAQRAQIEDIVRRKAGVPPENIIISTVVRD